MNRLRLRVDNAPYEVRRHWPFIAEAVIVLLSGISLILFGVAPLAEGSIWRSVAIEVGSVSIDIGVIGIAVETVFHSGLARDVFQAAFYWGLVE